MSKLTNLIKQISGEMELSSSEEVEFKNLVSAWESALDTAAAIEPDDDYSGDLPLLKDLDVQDENYADLRDQAPDRVREALDRYLDRRSD